MITQQVIDDFQNDGVVVLRNLFVDWIPRLSLGADFNAENPSQRALIHSTQGANGKFLEDFCSWERFLSTKISFFHHRSVLLLHNSCSLSQCSSFTTTIYIKKHNLVSLLPGIRIALTISFRVGKLSVFGSHLNIGQKKSP